MKHLGAFFLALASLGTAWALPAPARPAPDASLAAVLEECATMVLAPEGIPIRDRKVAFGHMEINFAEGTLVPVLGKSGSVLGVYFEGRGGYLYTTEDLADREALRTNTSRVASALRPMAGRIADDFKSGLLLFSAPLLAELYTGETPPPVATDGMSARFEQTLAGALNSYGEFDFRTAWVRLNGRGRWVYAELEGRLERVGYAYDDAIDGRERLFSFRKLADYSVRFSETLSYQPLPSWDRSRRQAVVLTHADIEVATQDNRTGSIASGMTYRVHDRGTRAIALSLYNNRDPDSPDWSSTRQKLEVKRVIGAEGEELPFSHKYNEIIVEIPATERPDVDVKLRFETAGDVFLDMDGRHTDNYFTLGLGGWYPSPMSWSGEKFTFTIKASCKKPWYPVTSGTLISQRDEGKLVVVESRSDRPASRIAVFGGKYITHAAVTDGVTVRIHAYAMARKNVLENMPKLAGAMVQFYTRLLGPMPFDELDIVEVPEYGFGVAPSGMILLTTEAYQPHHDELANLLVRGINARLAHEVAHQWFGHKANPDEAPENWIAESFAEYFAALAMGALAGRDKTIVSFERMFQEWRGEDKTCADGVPIAWANYLEGRQGWRDRYCLLYARGPLVLHMLRTSIGNEKFAAATKKFLDMADGGPASTDDFAKAISEAVQLDMRWFFDQWIRRSGNAQVDVEHHVDPAIHGQYRLWGTIRQNPGDGFRKLLVPLVWGSGGETHARVVFADQPEKTFDFVLPSKPGTVKPDPHQNNLAVYK